ncbi:MAG: cupin domain-containing protein [Desulfobacterales bacterium]|nr:cupin domain-containing protein [Desulfobacterales bacterium]
MTLEDLSGVSGVSKSMLGEIERGGTNPTILVLWKIAEGLKIPLTKLLEEEKKDYLVVRQNELECINNDAGFDIFTLFPYYDRHNLEVHKIEIQPGSALSNPGHVSGVDEYLFLLEGEVSIKTGDMEETLRPGDAIRFNAVSNHEIINITEEKACLLNVMVYK